MIHSWWIPALGGKFDAIPGVTNETWFNPKTRPGSTRASAPSSAAPSTRDAGGGRAPREEFDGGSPTKPRPRRHLGLGETRRLRQVPRLAGEGDIGPVLRGNQLLEDPEALEQVVRNGRNKMPPVGKDWEERQMEALTDYLQEELLGG